MKKISETDAKKILDIPFEHQDFSKKVTLRELFKGLIEVALDIKRPFGNSGWEHDIQKFLVDQRIINGEIDEYNCTEVDEDEYISEIKKLIKFL